MAIGQTRWLMYEQGAASISMPLVIVLVFWLTALFISFGLFAPRNGTVVASLLISALSVSGAILLILEMYTPYAGLIQVSRAPLGAALAHLGK
jgi:membrane-bound ClpP family serine protease